MAWIISSTRMTNRGFRTRYLLSIDAIGNTFTGNRDKALVFDDESDAERIAKNVSVGALGTFYVEEL